jgi:hypothetical protein
MMKLNISRLGDLKHSEKLCSVCGGHLISMTFLPRNWEGCSAFSARVGGKLCLFMVYSHLGL